MLDNHQFTLLIVAVGLGALLVSFSAVYHKEIDALTAELETSQGKPSGVQEKGNPEANVAPTKQSEKNGQRIDALTKANVEATPFGRGTLRESPNRKFQTDCQERPQAPYSLCAILVGRGFFHGMADQPAF